MGRIGAKAAAVLLTAALVATACGDDGGGSEAPASGSPASGSPIDDVLGTQAVQDFAVHVGMWVVDGDEVTDIYRPLLAELTDAADGDIALDGGFVLSPVDGVATSVVDSSGEVLPGVGVDLGLLRPDDGDTAAPLLLELVTADHTTTRAHVGLDDRSEIDVTFLDDVQPGDQVSDLYFFGQTLPGDPAAETGLSPHELLAHRWNRGLVRMYGIDGFPQTLLDTGVEVRSGSTILSRAQKGELAELLTLVLVAPTGKRAERALLDELWLNEDAQAGSSTTEATVPLPPTDRVLIVQKSVYPDGEVFAVADPIGGRGRGHMTEEEMRSYIKTYRLFVACTTIAAALVANNEVGRAAPVPVFDRFPSTRFVPDEPTEETSDDTDVEPEPFDPLGPEPDEPPPPGCNEPPEGDDPPPGGGIHGDVRVTTIDGITYGQQATGEFLVFENDTMVVQMRAEPAGDSQGLSIATAFAVGTGGASISMHGGGHTYVDGELRVLDRGERIRVGEAEVLWGYFDGWTIAWPDGQLVKIFDRGDGDGMSLTVQPGPGPAVGQLGDGDGDPDNDFVTRDGEPLSASIVDEFDAFYGTYVDSWRLTQDESLLHYDAGETTESFLIEGFPSFAVTMEELDPGDRADAEAACQAASVVDDALFEGCVIDVASTGDAGYAFDAFRVQLVTVRPDGSDGSDPEPSDDVTAETPGDTVLTFSGERLTFGEDPPNQREGGVAPSWDCQITDGNLFADGSIDLADGPRYAVSVQYLAAEPRFTLTVRRTDDDQTDDYAWVLTNVAHFADAIDDVTLDGSRLTASGGIYVNDPPQPGLAPFSQLPNGATLDPFTLDLDCAP